MKLYTWERWTLGLILTSVGLLAGYVSIFHVATWTMQNSPPGTSIVAGLTNAAISELIPAPRRRSMIAGPHPSRVPGNANMPGGRRRPSQLLQ